MRHLTFASILSLFALFVVSCGPMNGKELTELNDNQGKRLCKQMERKSSDCDDDEFEMETDCEDYKDEVLDKLPDDCAATVGDAKNCAAACGDDDNGGCQAIAGCAVAGF